MKYKNALCAAILLLLLLSGCGPSAEQIATMTASAWTPTPLPTATPTPLPYDLTVTVIDETGTPIAGASIVFPESGDGNPVQANDQGQYSWNNLRSEAVSLAVSSQGYVAAEQTATIQRGPNEVKVTLKRDLFAILPFEGCTPDQKILYVEDFQDGKLEGWQNISLGIDGNVPNGWTLLDREGNKILYHGDAPSPSSDELQGRVFNNFVWHLKYMVVGNDADMFFMWRISHEGVGVTSTTKRYAAVVGAKAMPWMVRFFDTPAGPNPLNTAQSSVMLTEGQWYNFDVAYFNGTHQVWMDGKMIMEYKDPKPYPEGTIGFETHLDQSKLTQFYMDNLVVCELSAPYQPPQ